MLDKALNEPAYSALYAQLCQRLDKCVPNFEPPAQAANTNSATPISTFRKLLLTVCQHEFDNRSNYHTCDERRRLGVLSEEEETKLHAELSRQNAKKKMLGNVKFIGELGRLDLLSEAILHRCIKTLLEKQRDEKYADMSEDLECLCKMMPTVGRKLDQGEAVKLMDQYFERMKKLGSLKLPAVPGQKEAVPALPQRIRFLLQDLIDLRASEWQPRQTQIDQAPKTMNEVRNGAIMEEMAAAAAVASSKEAQDAAAALSFNMSASFLPPNSVMFSSMPGRSALMMNMYHQLSQQPNMSLLNAINGKIASNKKEQLAASQNKATAAVLDVKPANTVELKQTHEASSPIGGRPTGGDTSEPPLSKPVVQSSSQTECGEANESLLLKRSNPISKQVVTHNFVSNQSEPPNQQHHQFIYSSHKSKYCAGIFRIPDNLYY